MGGGSVLRSEYSYPLLAKQPVGVPKTSILKSRIEPFYKPGQYEKVNLLAYVPKYPWLLPIHLLTTLHL
jgi:alpha-mannosidase